MGLFKKKNVTNPLIEYDPEVQKPVLKCSICNGEQVAGFKDIKTGKFTEVMLIKTNDDLAEFQKIYNVTEISKEY